MNKKNLTLAVLVFFGFHVSAQAKSCLTFPINAPSNNILSPTPIKNIKINKSALKISEDEKGYTDLKLFLDYSDGRDIFDHHVYVDCKREFDNYYSCKSDMYQLFLDLNSKQPILILDYIDLAVEGDEEAALLGKKGPSDVKIIGQYYKCENPSSEDKVIN